MTTENPPDTDPESAPDPLGMYTIRSLDQLKILGDPLRMRILEAFVRTPGTTKQVAKALGEPPTKLYHHVDALERAGLVELRSTRQNRGTLEKHYGAVASAFRVDPDLLPGEIEPASALGLGTDLLQRAADDFRRLEERIATQPEVWESQASKPMLTMLELHADEGELEEVRQKIESLLASLVEGAETGETGDEGRRRHRLVFALFPLDPPSS